VSAPTPRRHRDAEHVALPYTESSTLDEAYDDATQVARAYPVVRLPHQDIVNKMVGDARWNEICEEISTHGALERPYLD
jgi:hypothetical protein